MMKTTEYYNEKNLKILKSLDKDSLSSLMEFESGDSIKSVLTGMKRMNSPNKIIYNYSKQSTCGRLYANRLSLQGCPSVIRNILCKDMGYHDYDLVNAHYNITLNLCKENNLDCLHIEAYCKDRKAILEKEHQTKQSMLVFMYQDKPKTGGSQFLKGLHNELKNVKKIVNAKNEHLVVSSQKKNPVSSMYSKVLGIYENDILMKVINHFDIKNPTLVFDGFMTTKEYDVEEMKKITGYEWVEKPIEDVDISDFKSPYQEQKELFEENNFWTREPLQRWSRISPNHDYQQQSRQDFLDKLTEWDDEDIGFKNKWLADPDKRSYDSCDFNPDPNFNNPRIYNTFKPFAIKPINPPKCLNAPTEFVDLVNSLCNYDSDSLEYVMNYMAHLFQKPHENPETAIVFKGNQGTGKDTLTNIIEKLFGVENNYLVKLSDMNSLVGGFNECLDKKLVVQINEMSGRDGNEFQNKIKDMITKETNVINKKYLSIDYQTNYIRWFMFSNNLSPVIIEGTDRRFFICETADDKIGKVEFWKSFYKKLENKEYLQQILTYLLNKDISQWRPNVIPKTKDKRTSQMLNNNPIHLFLNEYNFDNLQVVSIKKNIYTVVSCNELFEDFKCGDFTDNQKLLKSSYFKKTVSALKSIDIKRIQDISTAECFAIDMEAFKNEIKYKINQAEEVKIDRIVRHRACRIESDSESDESNYSDKINTMR